MAIRQALDVLHSWENSQVRTKERSMQNNSLGGTARDAHGQPIPSWYSGDPNRAAEKSAMHAPAPPEPAPGTVPNDIPRMMRRFSPEELPRIIAQQEQKLAAMERSSGRSESTLAYQCAILDDLRAQRDG